MLQTRSIEILTRDECLRLLAENTFGRLALNLRSEAPMIRPINYRFDERTQSIVFRTDFGSKLQAVILASHASFEIDGVDHERRTGWSVIVTGRVEKVANSLELERFAHLGVDPWAPGRKPYWARIRVWNVTGRRIGPDELARERATGAR